MMNKRNDILNKNFLLYGIGISNISIKKYFDKMNVKYDIYDDFNKSLNTIKSINDTNYDYIIKSPSIIYKKDNVISDLELFYPLNKESYIITITGSSAKSTVASLISNVIESDLCGNIGKAIFDYIESNKLKVIEASSFMLDSIKTYRSNIFVITNIFYNHLDYHKDFNNYLISKTKPIYNMTKNDYLIYDSKCEILHNYIMKNRSNIKCHIIDINQGIFNIKNNNVYYKGNIIYTLSVLDEIKLKNSTNLLFTLYVYYIYTYNKDNNNNNIKDIINDIINNIIIIIKKALSYKELDYRLKIYKYKDLIICNDSKCTNTLSLKNSLDIFNKYQISLIIGGVKRANHDIKKELLTLGFDKYHNIEVIYIYGKYKDEIYDSIKDITKAKVVKIDIFTYDFLSDVGCYKNHVLLFSPALPSYDLFENYQKRGQFFDEIVRNAMKTE